MKKYVAQIHISVHGEAQIGPLRRLVVKKLNFMNLQIKIRYHWELKLFNARINILNQGAKIAKLRWIAL